MELNSDLKGSNSTGGAAVYLKIGRILCVRFLSFDVPTRNEYFRGNCLNFFYSEGSKIDASRLELI